MKWTDNLKTRLKDSPLFKTIVGVFSLIVCAVLTSWFIAEMTNSEGRIAWTLFYKTTPFYVILGFCFLIYVYYKFLYNEFENETVYSFKDNDYCKAYMRRECLPELARKAKALIKSENNSKKIREIIEDLNI